MRTGAFELVFFSLDAFPFTFPFASFFILFVLNLEYTNVGRSFARLVVCSVSCLLFPFPRFRVHTHTPPSHLKWEQATLKRKSEKKILENFKRLQTMTMMIIIMIKTDGFVMDTLTDLKK